MTEYMYIKQNVRSSKKERDHNERNYYIKNLTRVVYIVEIAHLSHDSHKLVI